MRYRIIVTVLSAVMMIYLGCSKEKEFPGLLLQDANQTVDSQWSEGSCEPCKSDDDCPNAFHTCITWEYLRFDSAAYAWVLDSVRRKCGAYGFAPCGY